MRLGTYYRYLVSNTLGLPLAGGRVLDVGGYDGYMLSHVSSPEKCLIDPDAVQAYPGIDYIRGDFLRYSFDGRKFDRILAFDVLEHVREDGRFLKKIVGLLAPGGMAVLSVPYRDIGIFPGALQGYVDKRWGHVYRRGYGREEIARLLESAGEKVEVDFIDWNFPVFRLLYLPLSALWRAFPALSRELFRLIIRLDAPRARGTNGYMFIVVKKGSSPGLTPGQVAP